MKANTIDSHQTSLALLAAVLTLASPTKGFAAQNDGLLISATAQTSILVGESLDITVVAQNTTMFPWEPGEDFFPFSWLAIVGPPSWGGWTSMGFISRAVIMPGEIVTNVAMINPQDLPTLPGNYSVSVSAAYNWFDIDMVLMDGSPKTVNFTVTSLNDPPVIEPIDDKTVVEGQLLSFTVTATDTNLPAQQITYSLGSGAPAQAGINPTNGAFSWTPPVGTAPATNEITVVATDNGSPPLSDTNTFKVTVTRPLEVEFEPLAMPVAGVVTLVWKANAGQTYRVQYKEDLSTNSWIILSPDVIATGATASTTNVMGNARQRFYQVVLLQ